MNIPLANTVPNRKEMHACRTDRERDTDSSKSLSTVIFLSNIRFASLTIASREGGFAVFASFMTKNASSNNSLSVFFKYTTRRSQPFTILYFLSL